MLLAKANVTLPTAIANVKYAYILQEQGGVGPLTLDSGQRARFLPGINLSPSGIISGTANDASGISTFTVHVTDSSNPQKSVTSGTVTINVPSP